MDDLEKAMTMRHSLLPTTIERISAAQTSAQLTDGEKSRVEKTFIEMVLNGNPPDSLRKKFEERKRGTENMIGKIVEIKKLQVEYPACLLAARRASFALQVKRLVGH